MPLRLQMPMRGRRVRVDSEGQLQAQVQADGLKAEALAGALDDACQLGLA